MKVLSILFLLVFIFSGAYASEPGTSEKPVIIESPAPAKKVYKSTVRQTNPVRIYSSSEPNQDTEIEVKPGTTIRNEINITFPKKTHSHQPLKIQSTPNLDQVPPPQPIYIQTVPPPPQKPTAMEKLGGGLYAVATCWTPFFEENSEVISEASFSNAGNALTTSGEVVRSNVIAPVKIVEKASMGVIDISTFWLP